MPKRNIYVSMCDSLQILWNIFIDKFIRVEKIWEAVCKPNFLWDVHWYMLSSTTAFYEDKELPTLSLINFLLELIVTLNA